MLTLFFFPGGGRAEFRPSIVFGVTFFFEKFNSQTCWYSFLCFDKPAQPALMLLIWLLKEVQKCEGTPDVICVYSDVGLIDLYISSIYDIYADVFGEKVVAFSWIGNSGFVAMVKPLISSR